MTVVLVKILGRKIANYSIRSIFYLSFK